MNKYINVKLLYNQVAEKEELARQRVIDTPSRLPNGDVNPYAIRYATQLDERTTFKFMLADAPAADMVEVVRCCKCIYWDRDTIRHQGNDFRDWNEAECLVLAERDGYNEINRYTEADDFCSRGERKDG